MPVTDGVFTPLTLDTALANVLAAAPSSIVFSPGNPPELVLANMFAQAWVDIDENEGEIMSLFMSPIGSMIDAMNPNNPRLEAIAATGYIKITNPGTSAVTVSSGTTVTAANGSTYTTDSAVTIAASNGTANVKITAVTAGIAANVAASTAFTITGHSALTAVNPLPFLNGAAAESDAIYLNRITQEKTEYGSQNGSIAVETEIKKYYPDASMYVNNTGTSLTTPIPVPPNGYNLVVKTPSGVLADSTEIAQIFQILSDRLEFVNSQTEDSTYHKIKSGSDTTNGVPLSYYFTVAQPVNTTIAITINVRCSKNATTSELTSQAVAFATYFINRLMTMFSGIDGTTDVTYIDSNNPSGIVTAVSITGTAAQSGTIAPRFGIGMVEALVNDIDTMGDTPFIVFDAVSSLTVSIDPQISGVSAIVLAIGGAKTFIDFQSDALFSDSTSFFDRYMYINPANITVTINEAAWM